MDEERIGVANITVPAPRDMSPAEVELLDRLRAGDEPAFADIVDRWSRSMLSVARGHVSTDASAQEVVQDTWLAVIRGLDGFQGRSSLKTWVFRILVNTAKTRAQREGRTIPFSALHEPARVPEAAVDPERFLPDDHPHQPGGWGSPPRELPEERLIAGETRAVIERAIEALPASQRAVISMRDVEGWSSEEVRNALDLSEVNQRVLLHRARARVRQALEDYLAPEIA